MPGIRGAFDYWNTAPYYDTEPVEIFATLGVMLVHRLPPVTDQQNDPWSESYINDNSTSDFVRYNKRHLMVNA